MANLWPFELYTLCVRDGMYIHIYTRMLPLHKFSIFEITVSDSDSIPYFPRPEEDHWKIETLQLMMGERERGCLDDAYQAVMDHLCEY